MNCFFRFRYSRWIRIAFHVPYPFIALHHQRRKVAHFNLTEHPTAQWRAQQIVEAFPFDMSPRYPLLGAERVVAAAAHLAYGNSATLSYYEVKPWFLGPTTRSATFDPVLTDHPAAKKVVRPKAAKHR